MIYSTNFANYDKNGCNHGGGSITFDMETYPHRQDVLWPGVPYKLHLQNQYFRSPCRSNLH